MLRGIIKKLISTVSLLISDVGDFIVTAAGDNILISASPFSDLKGSIEAVTTYTGNLSAVDLITGSIEVENMTSVLSGNTSGTVRG